MLEPDNEIIFLSWWPEGLGSKTLMVSLRPLYDHLSTPTMPNRS